jgi:hypothetical protein
MIRRGREVTIDTPSLSYLCIEGGGGAFRGAANPRTREEFLSCQDLVWLRGRTIGALRAEVIL